MTLAPAVVMNLQYTGIGIARDLGRNGIPVIGISHERNGVGRMSRHLSFRQSPDSSVDGERLLLFLESLARELPDGAVLFPTRDADLLFMDLHRETLSRSYRMVLPDSACLGRILDKYELHQAALRAGVSSPRTSVARSAGEALAAAKSIGFPLVVKPRFAADWRSPEIWEKVGKRKAWLVNRAADLDPLFRAIGTLDSDFLLQEWIPGSESDFYILGCHIDRSRRYTGGVTLRKWLQYPPDFGTGCLVEAIRDDEVKDAGLRILSALDFHGIAEVEFKRDGTTGELKLVEINPRPWDQHALASCCGINLSLDAYRDASALDIPAREGTDRAFWISGGGLIYRIAEDLKDGRHFPPGLFLRVLAGRRVYPLLEASDPAPFMAALPAFAKELGGTAKRWILQRIARNTNPGSIDAR